MNNNIKNENPFLRKTRSHQILEEDKNLFDMSYIDNYYSKKKKKNLISILNNDTLSPTKIKFPMPNLFSISINNSEINSDSLEKKKHPKKTTNKNKLTLNRTSLGNFMENSKELNNYIDELVNEKNHRFEEKKKDPKKLDMNILIKMENIEINNEIKEKEKTNIKLFAVEQKNSDNNITTKPVKKRSKRYLELLENSLLIFDRDDKKLISNKKPKQRKVIENPQIKDQTILDTNSEKFTTNKFNDEGDIKIFALEKNFVQLKSSNDINKLNLLGNNSDIFLIYDELKNIRMLGKKRNFQSLLGKPEEIRNKNLHSFELTQFPNVSFTNYNNINLNCVNENSNICNRIKKFFINSEIEENLKLNLSCLNISEKKMIDKNIPNPFDESIRREYANHLGFIETFQEDYAPIKMQKDNEKIFEIFENSADNSTVSNSTNNSNISSSKSHFIKKKQSAVNIKRQCGVSYVVPTESKQLNVIDKYKPLGHVVYQGTYSINQTSDENICNYIDNLIVEEMMNKPLLVTIFESPNEEEMKEYLLYPEKRMRIAKEVFLIASLDELWKFSKDKFFLAVNLIFDNITGVRNFTTQEISNSSPYDLLFKSDIQIGILFRKATSGIKSVLKLYKNGGLDKIQHSSTFKLCNLNSEENIDTTIERVSGTNMTTLSMRIELFVFEQDWKRSNYFCKEFLYNFISQVEEKISKLILNWNEYRNLMFSLSKDNKIREYIHNFPYYSLNTDKCKSAIKKESKSFNLDKSQFTNKINAEITKEIKFDMSKSDLFKLSNSFADKLSLINNLCFQTSPLPMYIISTRDCFVFDLNVKIEELILEGRKYIRKEYFFDENTIPSNYHKFRAFENDLRVGIVTYENYFTNEELIEIERNIEQTEEYSLKDAFLPETAQKTLAGEKLKRTKFFFGSRYMWTKKQLAEPNSYVGAGIRKDVSPPPFWIKEKIEDPLVKAGIMLGDFVNSYALNVYHDGSEGLGQHFDDAVRFKQPIYTLRLFSDCRLSFGSQLYGFCNGAFTIPLPRGCICIMEENSYASNGVKHCIRPCDMTGKSSALILRQMHPNMINEAEKYDLYVDFPSWFSCLSVNEDALTYNYQKSLEAEFLIKISEIEKKNKKIHISNTDDGIIDIINDMIDSVEMYNSKNYKKFLTPINKKRAKKNDNLY